MVLRHHARAPAQPAHGSLRTGRHGARSQGGGPRGCLKLKNSRHQPLSSLPPVTSVRSRSARPAASCAPPHSFLHKHRRALLARLLLKVSSHFYQHHTRGSKSKKGAQKGAASHSLCATLRTQDSELLIGLAARRTRPVFVAPSQCPSHFLLELLIFARSSASFHSGTDALGL